MIPSHVYCHIKDESIVTLWLQHIHPTPTTKKSPLKLIIDLVPLLPTILLLPHHLNSTLNPENVT